MWRIEKLDFNNTGSFWGNFHSPANWMLKSNLFICKMTWTATTHLVSFVSWRKCCSFHVCGRGELGKSWMSALSQTQLIFTHCRMKQVVKRSMQKKKESKRSKSHLFKKTSLMSPFSAQLSTKSSSEQFLEICRFFCSTRSLLLLSLWCYSCVKSERYDGKAGFNIVEFSQLLDWNSDCVTRQSMILQ